MLLVDDDQPDIHNRCKDREPRAEHDPGLAPAHP